MKPENILKANALDILFENKNKDYGAYNLRKFYNHRLVKSILGTFSLVVLFCILQSWKKPKFICTLEVGPTITLENFIDDVKKVEIEKPKVLKHNKVFDTETTPIIVKAKIDTPKIEIPAQNHDNFNEHNNGNEGLATGALTSSFGSSSSAGNGQKENPITALPSIAIENEIEEHPSVMPEFIGGSSALRDYMLRNLAQPNDIEHGEKIVVLVKFVVSKNGEIDDVVVIKNGREDLDAEVIRVIKNMPNWKPGIQNGYKVSAYFTMPVSFVGND